ncbi:MAG: hypothetical protein AAFN17_08960 [Pseudomonadota bacterium]
MLHLAAAQASVQPIATADISRAHLDHALTLRETQTLAFLRSRAVMVRVAPRVEPFHFCALIETNPHLAAEAYADGALHVLPKAIGRPVVFRRDGAQAPSFDESWVLGILAACDRDDEASVRFGVASRCAAAFRRPLAFLFKGLASRLDEVAGTLS